MRHFPESRQELYERLLNQQEIDYDIKSIHNSISSQLDEAGCSLDPGDDSSPEHEEGRIEGPELYSSQSLLYPHSPSRYVSAKE